MGTMLEGCLFQEAKLRHIRNVNSHVGIFQAYTLSIPGINPETGEFISLYD